jgi:hypothetical protein
VALILLVPSVTGCVPKCDLTNLTTHVFPSDRWSLARSVQIPGDSPDQEKFRQLMDVPGVMEGFDNHRFMLLVEPTGTDEVKAFVTVNGIQHPMIAHQRGLWTFESPDQCNRDYTYYYQVGCGVVSDRLGSASSPFTATVQGWDNIGWYVSGEGYVNTILGTVDFMYRGARTIIIQNMRPEATIQRIEFYPDEMAEDNEKFEIRDLPTLPAILRCGEVLEFEVFWDQQGLDLRDYGTIVIFAEWPNPYTPGQGVANPMYVHLKGEVVP